MEHLVLNWSFYTGCQCYEKWHNIPFSNNWWFSDCLTWIGTYTINFLILWPLISYLELYHQSSSPQDNISTFPGVSQGPSICFIFLEELKDLTHPGCLGSTKRKVVRMKISEAHRISGWDDWWEASQCKVNL